MGHYLKYLIKLREYEYKYKYMYVRACVVYLYNAMYYVTNIMQIRYT